MSDKTSANPTRIQSEQLLREMNDDWVKALVRNDGETLDRIMADDFCFAYPFEGDDKSQFISDVLAGNIRVEHLVRENLIVRIWESTAVLTGNDAAKWYYQGRDFSGRYKTMHVYSYRNGNWRLVSIQAVPID